jgi:hypothetical protein
MRPPHSPPLEPRREKEFEAELLERAHAWLPSWALTEDEPDFGRALLKIAARFNSEVAERLDRGGDKMQRGFLDWLAVRGIAARPARMPVVLKLADNTPDPVLATAPVRMQADTDTAPVVFETEADVCLLPGELKSVVGVDATKDAFYLPPPGLSDLKPLDPLPTQWQLKSFAAAGATKLQLDPDTGLVNDMILEALGAQYTIVQVDKDIVTITPPLAQGLAGGQVVTKVSAFAPFDRPAQNWQEHALYLGDSDLLNIEAAAQIEVVGAKGIGDNVSWQYWAGDEKGWQPLTLATQQPSDGVLLSKPSGAIETKEIGSTSSRWIRAYTKTASGDPFRTDSKIGLRVNSTGCDKDITCDDTKDIPSPAAEAMANTTPLVLDGTFYPLGKQPKQFDSFYLGSQEAFSKKGADIQLCFQMADLTFAALSTISGTNLLAGVGQDQALHLLQFDSSSRTLKKYLNRDPLRPPSPGFGGVAPSSTNPVQLDAKPPWRLPMWIEFHPFASVDLFVATTAGNEVWIWHERIGDSSKSGWLSLGPLSTTAASGTSDPVDGLVYLADLVSPKIAALRDGKLFVRDWPTGANWTTVPTLDTGVTVVLKSIVPVIKSDAGQLVTSVADGMVGVSDGNDLYSVTATGVCTKLGTDQFSIESRVAAFMYSSKLTVVGVDASDPAALNAFRESGVAANATIPSTAKVVGAVEVLFDGTNPWFLAATENSLVSWGPLGFGAPQLSESDIPSDVGHAGGGPTALGHDVVVPGTHADLLVSDFDVTRQKVESATIEAGIVVPDSTVALAFHDVLAREGSTPPESHFVDGAGLTREGETLYPLDSDFSTLTGAIWAYRQADTLSGTFADPTDYSQFTLDPADREGIKNEWVLIGSVLYHVIDVDHTDPRLLTISPVPTTPPSPINYVRRTFIGGRVAPFMRLDPNPGGSGDWDAGLLQRIKLTFPGQTPAKQSGKAFSLVSNHPVVVVLDLPFRPSFTGSTNFIVDAAAVSWARLLGDTTANPELSWEYWNGTGWGKLPIKSDATLNLKASGALRFEVPDDLAPTDWSGKTDCWIRARLVGGDYGSEKITVTTTAISSSVSQQTVERSAEGISAPLVVKLHIFYRICKPGVPAYLLTQDSGSTRDQSDANRTGGAIVEAFVPLGLMLARLSGTTALATTPPPCPPPCNCSSKSTTAASTNAATASGAATPAATAVVAETGRSLFLGFTKPLLQQPVNVLLLVDQERDHGAFAPLNVEALIGDRFVPIVTHDTTRALGESGLLSMSFSVGPTQRELFGQALYWLHLKPAATDSSGWKPTMRGAYLNAVWASATETMTRELVGSSAGEPNLTLILGRPPLLYNTLELRVREPLGQEARDTLLAEDKNLVKSSEQDLPGDWVLWKQVIDPADEDPGARVYALDESAGEIRFGDGLHGAIPPIGSDSIVAFTYKRTEPGPPGSTDVPANSIPERTQLGLVSPVPSVESAISADHAAGGAPPEPPDRVVRFGTARLRHRGRAVTARDLEDLALQSSPKIAQARCFARSSYVKLVVVMQGETPSPSAVQVRELRSLLLTAAPAALGVNQALRIQGPDIRVLRVALLLTITDLDFSGEVARDAKQRVTDLFDAATGGIAKNGWQLGQNPDPSDIAYVLSTVDRLEGIERIDPIEIVSDGSERPWTGSLQRTELAVLSDDPVRINFNVVEVVA